MGVLTNRITRLEYPTVVMWVLLSPLWGRTASQPLVSESWDGARYPNSCPALGLFAKKVAGALAGALHST